MRLLLDTHVLLWCLADSPELSADTRGLVIDGSNEVAVSVASAWELAIKQATGKPRAPDDLAEALEDAHLMPLPITLQHALAAGALPMHHRDPFDRMLIAQALIEGLTIVTRDVRFEPYGVPLLAA